MALAKRLGADGVHLGQSDEDFNRTLGRAIDEIYEASVTRIPA